MERVAGWWRSGCLPIAAVLVAPFLALTIDPNLGLLVTTGALAVTTWLSVDTLRRADRDQRRSLFIAAALNALLAVACLVVLLVRLVE